MHLPPLSVISQRNTEGISRHVSEILQRLVEKQTPFACRLIQSSFDEDIIEAQSDKSKSHLNRVPLLVYATRLQ